MTWKLLSHYMASVIIATPFILQNKKRVVKSKSPYLKRERERERKRRNLYEYERHCGKVNERIKKMRKTNNSKVLGEIGGTGGVMKSDEGKTQQQRSKNQWVNWGTKSCISHCHGHVVCDAIGFSFGTFTLRLHILKQTVSQTLLRIAILILQWLCFFLVFWVFFYTDHLPVLACWYCFVQCVVTERNLLQNQDQIGSQLPLLIWGEGIEKRRAYEHTGSEDGSGGEMLSALWEALQHPEPIAT